MSKDRDAIVKDLLDEYKHLTIRRNKAIKFFKSPNISEDEKNRWMPEYQKLCDKLNKVVSSLKMCGGL